MKDNRESDQNRYSLFTVRDAENAMTAFTIFAIAVIFGIFFYALLITHKLPITLNNIVSSLSAVVVNVSSVLSAATLLTILLEGADIMLFRRTREERAKLKAEKRELEELKKEIQTLQNGSREGQTVSSSGDSHVVAKSGNVKSGTKPPKQSARPETKQPSKPENAKPNK